MLRKLNGIRSSLNSQIQDAIITAITEKVLPSIQNTIGLQERSDFTVEDRRSSGLQRSPGTLNSQKTWENLPKSAFTRENQRQVSIQSSVDSYTGEQNRDRRECNMRTRMKLNTYSVTKQRQLHSLTKKFNS